MHERITAIWFGTLPLFGEIHPEIESNPTKGKQPKQNMAPLGIGTLIAGCLAIQPY
jgi:hypothetical protein